MQLTLLDAVAVTLNSAIAELSVTWSTRLPVRAHLAEAERVTAARFAGWAGRELSPAELRRIRAYYGAVVRNRVVHGRDTASSAARRLLVQASIESDLREAGWHPDRAREEARRCAGLEPVLTGAA